MILIKEYEVIDRKHLEAYESLWINSLICINTNSPFCVTWISRKKYYEQNKILKLSTRLRAKNGDLIRERMKQYNAQREAERKERIHCSVCKYDIVKRELQRHNRSARHQANLIEYHEPTHEKKHRFDLCNVEVMRLNRHYKSAMHQANLSS